MATVSIGSAFTVHVAEAQAGMRLDRCLAEALPELSRSRLQALIEAGQVVVDLTAARAPSQRVKGGQVLTVQVPEPEPAWPVAQAIGLDVVYEDEDLIVVNKPAGLVVHPAPGNPDRTLVNALLAHCGDSLSGVGGTRRPGIVHRLDKDTSGLLVAAKNDLAHYGLSGQFAAHTVDRAYKAVVWGVPSPGEGSIGGNIGRSRVNRKKMALVTSGGKPATTRYRVIKAFGTAASLIECRLLTGRTHQIRVHMASIGHGVVGDPVYGRPRQGDLGPAAGALRGFSRQALHAELIGFSHPRTGFRLRFTADLPCDIKALTVSLEQ